MVDMDTDQSDQPQPTDSLEQSGNQTDNIAAADSSAEVVQFDPQAYQATLALINQIVDQLEEVKRRSKLFAEQLKDLVDNNPALSAAKEEAEAANLRVKQIKTTILESPEGKNLKANLVELREQKKELEESLSAHLFDLYQTTGVMEFEAADGSVYEYKILAKLRGKKR